jgi:hypothetical protein
VTSTSLVELVTGSHDNGGEVSARLDCEVT